MGKRRSIDQRIEDKMAELAELKAKKSQKKLDDALEQGMVSKENEKEFKKLQGQLKSLAKANKVAQEYKHDELIGELERLIQKITDELNDLVGAEAEAEEEEDE